MSNKKLEDLTPKNRVALIEAHLANGWSYQRVANEMGVSADYAEIIFNRVCAIHDDNFELIRSYDRALRRVEKSGFATQGQQTDALPGVTGLPRRLSLAHPFAEVAEDRCCEVVAEFVGAVATVAVGVGEGFEVVHIRDSSTGPYKLALPIDGAPLRGVG